MEFGSISDALNGRGRTAIRWCTPSINPHVRRVLEPYDSDASISFESFGLPLEPTGLFRHAFELAAGIFGADHTLFSVNGTTWSNFVVIRALAKQHTNLRVLAGRNVHRSVVSACEDYGVRLTFLPTRMHEEYHTFVPNTVNEILSCIERTKPHVLLLTTPTYEGLTVDLNEVVRHARKLDPHLIVFVDEAWGAHLHFSPRLPVSAMAAGADICVQSTHKQGGSLQQTGMIHWQGERVDSQLVRDAYRTLGTSSPSYLLMASLEEASAQLAAHGADQLDRMIDLANTLATVVASVPGLAVAEIHRSVSGTDYERDTTKVVVDVSASGLSGYEVARGLEVHHDIVVESCNGSTVLLLVPFMATLSDVEATRVALEKIVIEGTTQSKGLQFPERAPKAFDLVDVSMLPLDQLEEVRLQEAVGRISGEHITPFPPGIPTTIKGELFTADLVNYYDRLRVIPNIHIAARDARLNTVWVVRQDAIPRWLEAR